MRRPELGGSGEEVKRSTIAGATVISVLLVGCTPGSGHGDSSATAHSTASSGTATPTATVQNTIPDGIYRTRPRTEQDLVALGLTKKQIDYARNVNELWKKTIVYELRIKGDQYVLTAASDGDAPIVADHGTFTLHGHTMSMFTTHPSDGYVMRFSISDGILKLTVLRDPCKKTDPEHCSVFLVRAAYEALPFEAVS